MSDGRKYYCFCDSNCKFETMTKEQILAAIAQAVETGNIGNCDTGFISKVKEQNGGGYVTFWVGTQAEYNAIEKTAKNCLYIITDDTTTADVRAAFAAAQKAAEDAAAEAAKIANAMMFVDLTNDISLSFTASYGGGGTNATVTTKKYYFRYYPTLKIMTYSFAVYITGTMAKGEQIHFLQVNGPDREGVGSQTIMQTSRRNSTGENCDGRYVNFTKADGSYAGCGVVIQANEAVNTGGAEHSIFCQGWHYVN